MNIGSILRMRNKGCQPILGAALVGMILSLGLIAPSSAQTITLCRPNGGESWTAGEKHPIHWNWTGSISLVNIEYSTDGGSTWNVILTDATNDGNAMWTVPYMPSTTCCVKVTSAANPNVYDTSDASFTIASPVITLSRPNGGESWTAGEKHPIHWNWIGTIGSVNLEYSTDGGSTWNVCLSGTANDGDALWTVPNTPSATCRVRAANASDTSCLDVSDQDFSITSPTVSLVRPDGGETYYEGKVAPIHWTTSGTISSVKLECSTNGGSAWTEIVSSTTNDGRYGWSIPDGVSGTTCKVRITDTADLNSYDVSAANFTIMDTIPPDSLHLFSPRTDDAWLVGKYYYICWTHAGSNSTVKLEYATDGGSTWNLITSSTANDGEYEWNVPSAPGAGCRIRISNTANPNVYDVSDVFTIQKQWILASSPITGDAWVIGKNHYITWTYGGWFNNAKLQYSTDRGTTWSTINSSTYNGGTYEWTVPEPPSANGKIRISNVDNPDAFGLSDVFQAAPQTIVMTSPLTGDIWQADRKYYIAWRWDGLISDLKLLYSTDRGSTWSTITSSTGNYGYYEWKVPNVGSTNCIVKVASALNGAVYAVSNVFTILPRLGISERASNLGPQSLVAEPNPSRGRTTLRYVLIEETDVKLVVLDASGRQVRALVGARVPAGTHSIAWDRRAESGKLLPSGIYFCRMVAGGFQTIKKLIVQ
jgi:hypothetical protein